MSPRYLPEQLDELASEHAHMPCDGFQSGLNCLPCRTAAQLRQGASDARVIAQLREWLRQGEHLDMPTTGDFYDGLRQGISNTLIELDRLTHPAEEAEKS